MTTMFQTIIIRVCVLSLLMGFLAAQRQNCGGKFPDCPAGQFCAPPGRGILGVKGQHKCYDCPCAQTSQCYFGSEGDIKCNCGPDFTGQFCETPVCGAPPAPTDGSVAVSADRSSALFSCDPGYSLTGATSMPCVDGEWVGTLPTCTANDCKALRDSGVTVSGVYSVQLWSSGATIQVYCDMQTDGGGWTVFQNRYDGSVDFYRGFAEYENGFGNLEGEFWLGLKYVQEMALLGPTELRIDESAADGTTFYHVYQNFYLGSGNNYTLYIGERSGSAPNDPKYTLLYHNGSCFSTYDRSCNRSICALYHEGAWWFKTCFTVHLNGVYGTPGSITCTGILDNGFKRCEKLASSKMMFRRV